MVGPADLARYRQPTPTADEAGGGHAVMRGTKRARPVQRPVARQLAEEAADLGHVESLTKLERRQDPREAAREHRLAGAGRAAEQEMMSARGRHLERPLGLLLAMHLDQVVVDRTLRRPAPAVRRRDRDRLALQ